MHLHPALLLVWCDIKFNVYSDMMHDTHYMSIQVFYLKEVKQKFSLDLSIKFVKVNEVRNCIIKFTGLGNPMQTYSWNFECNSFKNKFHPFFKIRTENFIYYNMNWFPIVFSLLIYLLFLFVHRCFSCLKNNHIMKSVIGNLNKKQECLFFITKG